jgi:hypothetical protein
MAIIIPLVYQNRSVAYNVLMSTRRAKQLIYGALYLILLVALVAIVYFLVRLIAPAPVTVAPCTENCMPVDASAIVTSTVQTFVSSTGRYTFLAQIANTSPGYAAQYFEYAIDLYDASGTVIQSIPGSSIVYASETKYLVVPNVAIATPPVSVGLVITNPSWAASASLGSLPQFSTENITTGATSSTVSVSGQVANANISTFRYLFVDVIFTGTNGSPAGASQTEIDNVAPGKTVDFSVMYPQTGGINPAASRVLVYGLK